jgi:hypothetical protein
MRRGAHGAPGPLMSGGPPVLLIGATGPLKVPPTSRINYHINQLTF